MVRSRFANSSNWPFGVAVAALLAAGAAWGQTEWTKYEGNPVLERGAPGEWDEGLVDHLEVLFDGVTYHMWYNGGQVEHQTDIGYAISPDGVTWTKYPGNPVLRRGDAGTWDSGSMQPGAVVWDGAAFHMWYAAGAVPGGAGAWPTGYATSPDGVTWTKHPGNPVLPVGSAGSWDSGGAVITAVLAEGGSYRAWYWGYQTVGWSAMGYATSPDGVTWTKHLGNPVLEPRVSQWDSELGFPSVVSAGGVFHMWYTSGMYLTTARIGHAVSVDGIHWARQPSSPVLVEGEAGDFDELGVGCPRVLLIGDTAHMFFIGIDGDGVLSYGSASAPLPFPQPPLLLNDGRFRVESTWWTTDLETGTGDPYPLTADSGAFIFFDPANIELLVKILDGCAINQRYWVFVAGLTDVGVGLTVTDTETGERKTYSNTAGVPFEPILDTDAFALCE
jgi:predicted GH43/DUF377 family glycosyl hydrolase